MWAVLIGCLPLSRKLRSFVGDDFPRSLAKPYASGHSTVVEKVWNNVDHRPVVYCPYCMAVSCPPGWILLQPVARQVLGAGALTYLCWAVCSRVDTEVDKRLDAIGSPEAQQLKGKAAVAQAKLAYELAQK
jgi:hypothetical protein